MCNLFLVQLLYALCIAYIALVVTATSSESASNNDNYTNNVQLNKEKFQKRPHIIVILADDMGWNDVSFHGSNQIPTPNIDALAYNGVILNRHYVSPVGTQTRSALMTGKHPSQLGMQHGSIYPSEPRGLPLTEKLLPQYLKEVGYKTHIVGKWHLGFHKKEYTPTYRGFDTHFGYWNGFQDYYSHVVIEPINEEGFARGFDMRRNVSVAWDTVGKYSTDLFTEEAVRLINAHDPNDPMFLYLSHLAPHSGNATDLLQAPEEEIAKFSYIEDPGRKIYAAMVSKLDQSVGEVVEALKNRTMLEDSIILFLSDNGAPTDGISKNYGSNYPLRGIKDSPWEGGVRGVAAIWSLLIKKRQVLDNLMFISDWLPTLLFAANVREKNISKIDGFSMWPVLTGVKDYNNRRCVLLNIDDIEGYEAVIYYNWKLINGTSRSSHFDWLGDSGRSLDEFQPPYVPEKVLHSKAGSAITWIQTNRLISDANQINKNELTPKKILQLRKQAEIHCNVTEEERIPCDLSVSPCIFDVKRNPCEMINEASSIINTNNIVLQLMQRCLNRYRSSMVFPSNKPLDPEANPIH